MRQHPCDMTMYQCVRCSNYWSTNASQSCWAIIRLCPTCVAILPQMTDDPPSIHALPPAEHRDHARAVAEVRSAAPRFTSEERRKISKRRAS